MNFVNPQFLWGFLALIPLIIAYLLKVKPRRQPTNAWFLWQKVFEEKSSSALFSKLKIQQNSLLPDDTLSSA